LRKYRKYKLEVVLFLVHEDGSSSSDQVKWIWVKDDKREKCQAVIVVYPAEMHNLHKSLSLEGDNPVLFFPFLFVFSFLPLAWSTFNIVKVGERERKKKRILLEGSMTQD
jgi:hypothetical protein